MEGSKSLYTDIACMVLFDVPTILVMYRFICQSQCCCKVADPQHFQPAVRTDLQDCPESLL